jgi:hypothetical protein
MYQAFDAGYGSLHGMLTLIADPLGVFTNNAVTGTLTWSKPTNSTRLYGAGFSPINLTAFGKYLAPSASGHVILGLPASTVTSALRFTQGGLSLASINPDVGSFLFTNTLTVVLPTAGSPANPGSATLAINTATGAISGGIALQDGTLHRTASYSGIIVRPASGIAKAVGYFLLPQIPVGLQTSSTSPILSGRVAIEQ